MAAWPAPGVSYTAADSAHLSTPTPTPNPDPLCVCTICMWEGRAEIGLCAVHFSLFLPCFLSHSRARALSAASPARLCGVLGNVVRYALFSLSALRTRYVSPHGVGQWRAGPGCRSPRRGLPLPPPSLQTGTWTDMYIMFCSSRALSALSPLVSRS